MAANLSGDLGRNLKTLREARGFTQAQIAEAAGLPRATWSNLESGAGNPTLAVLHRVALALSVSLEELIARPRPAGRRYRKAELRQRQRGKVVVRGLVPERLPGLELDRMAFPPGERLVGVPHNPGTREYLTCESGKLELWVAGERFELEAGDVVVFRGDQKHSYRNAGSRPAVGYAVVVLNPPASWGTE